MLKVSAKQVHKGLYSKEHGLYGQEYDYIIIGKYKWYPYKY